MPTADFYEGLVLAERLQKFLDHHAAPRNRHISKYEAAMLEEAIGRINQTIAVATRQARVELEESWRTLPQQYETVVTGRRVTVEVLSLPRWQVPATQDDLVNFGLREVVASPEAWQLQAVLAAALTAKSDGQFRARYAELIERPSDVERSLPIEDLAVLNRLLYQPTVAVEQSHPIMESLLAAVERVSPGVPAVVVFVGFLASGQPFLAVLGAIGVILLQAANTVVQSAATAVSAGAEPNLRAFGAKLTASLGEGALPSPVPPPKQIPGSPKALPAGVEPTGPKKKKRPDL